MWDDGGWAPIDEKISGFHRRAGVDAFDARARIPGTRTCTYRGILVVVALAGDLHAEFAGNLCRWERDVGITVSTSVFLRSYGNAACKP